MKYILGDHYSNFSGALMKNFSNFTSLFTIILSVVYFFSLIDSSVSSVTFQGGIISSVQNLKTEKPKNREDLFYDITKLDFSHLQKKLSITDAIRFENRIGIGAPFDRVKRYVGMTRKEAINLVVTELENFNDNFLWPEWLNDYTPTFFIEDGLNRSKLKCNESMFRSDLELIWSKSLLTNPVPQFEKLALLWLDHFSVAFDEYNQTHSFARHLQIIRKNTFGNFRDFLRESIRDPGIIIYLNNEQSTSQNPNENLAREFLELFALGEGNYSENEIKNFAKKLPSFSINHVTQDFHLYKYKSSGQILSGFGRKFKSADEFIDLVIEHPAFGELIAKKFYQEFISLEEPSSDELAVLVSTFRQNDFNIVKLFETVISLKSFWNENNKLTLVKSPIELVFGTARTLGVKAWKLDNLVWLVKVSKEFGQDLFNPPNIAGWPTGKEWLSGQFLEKRMSRLPYYFSERKLFSSKNRFLSFKNETASSMIKSASKYQDNLKNFYSDIVHNQLAVETIVINWIPSDFETREWADINVGFYGVKLNGKWWDGLNVRFGTDINSKNKQEWKLLNRIQFSHGYSHPDIISSWKGSWVSSWSGHYDWNSSFPIGPRMKNFSSKSKDERLLMIRLLQSMEHLLNNKKASPQLMKNSYVQNWIEERVKETNIKKYSLEDGSIPTTKVFSYTSIFGKDSHRMFLCGPSRAGIDLRIQALIDEKLVSSLTSNYLESEDLKLTKLLLPEINLDLEDKDFLSIISYEGYQLK